MIVQEFALVYLTRSSTLSLTSGLRRMSSLRRPVCDLEGRVLCHQLTKHSSTWAPLEGSECYLIWRNPKRSLSYFFQCMTSFTQLMYKNRALRMSFRCAVLVASFGFPLASIGIILASQVDLIRTIDENMWLSRLNTNYWIFGRNDLLL